MDYWKLRFCDWTRSDSLVDYLKAGWEPFAVTDAADGPPTIWLRKRVDNPVAADLCSI
jgi:hypothetical protein